MTGLSRMGAIDFGLKGALATHVLGYVTWQRKPSATAITGGHVFEKLLIQLCPVLGGSSPPVKAHVVGVNVHQRHPSMFSDPIKLACPGGDRRFLEQKKKS